MRDPSGNALQLSLPYMIRLVCKHDLFHAHGNARDRRDGERVTFLTNSPHIAMEVEGTDRRRNLNSEICEGLRQQVGDADHASSTMRVGSGTQVRPFDLTLQILKSAVGGVKVDRFVQELNSIREGKYWDDAKRRMFGSRLGSKGA